MLYIKVPSVHSPLRTLQSRLKYHTVEVITPELQPVNINIGLLGTEDKECDGGGEEDEGGGECEA